METVKIVASDYVGFQVGSSLTKMKFEYKDSPLKVTIDSILYRLLIKGFLPSSFLNFFNGIKDDYLKNMVIDAISLAVLNVITLNLIGDKKSISKTVIKSAIQAVVSNALYTNVLKSN